MAHQLYAGVRRGEPVKPLRLFLQSNNYLAVVFCALAVDSALALPTLFVARLRSTVASCPTSWSAPITSSAPRPTCTSAISSRTAASAQFVHFRELSPHRQSAGDPAKPRHSLLGLVVFDLDAGPVTITLPDAGGRFMSMQVIDRGPLRARGHLYSQAAILSPVRTIGTRYVAAAVRILVDPNDPADLDAVHALQDAIDRRAGRARAASRCPTGIR